MSKKQTHFRYDKLEKNRKGELEVTGSAVLTEEEMETLNVDFKRTGVKYEKQAKTAKK